MNKTEKILERIINGSGPLNAAPGNILIEATISRVLKARVVDIAELSDSSFSAMVNFLLNVGASQYEAELRKSAEDQADLEYKAKMAAEYDELADILYKNSEVTEDDEIPF